MYPSLEIELQVATPQEVAMLLRVREAILKDKLQDLKECAERVGRLLSEDYKAGCANSHVWIHRTTGNLIDRKRIAIIKEA